MGATALLSELLISFGSSADIFRSSMACLCAIGSFPSHAADMLVDGTCEAVLNAASTYSSGAVEEGSLGADTVDNLSGCFTLMRSLASHDATIFVSKGFLFHFHFSCLFELFALLRNTFFFT